MRNGRPWPWGSPLLPALRSLSLPVCLAVLLLVLPGCIPHYNDLAGAPDAATESAMADGKVGGERSGGEGETCLDCPVPCGSDADCPDGRVCAPEYAVCVECYEDGHCNEGTICISNECSDTPVCDEDAACPEGLVCDLELHACVECLGDEDCPEDTECVGSTCSPTRSGCPNIAGAYDVQVFCDGSIAVEMDEIPLLQQDCQFSDPYGLFTGVISDDGSLTLSTQQEDFNMAECNGMFEDGAEGFSVDCSSGCTAVFTLLTSCSCVGKECGTDGCGGSCGSCDEGMYCEAGVCKPDTICAPGAKACKDEITITECNGDGTAVLEYDCPPDSVCYDGECYDDICVPECDGKECGPAGCPGFWCGNCPSDFSCVDGLCQPDCQPNCTNKQCGDDGCGGSCGACPANQVCAWDGKCYSSCDPDAIPFSEIVQKFVSLTYGDGGHPGEALDIDDDVATCTPQGDCEVGLDNQFGGLVDQLAAFVDMNQQLTDLVQSGGSVLLVEFENMKFDGTSFALHMFVGEPVLPKGQCNFQTSTCEYVVSADQIDWESCTPMTSFDNATILDGKLHAGGSGYQLAMKLSMFPFPGPPFVIAIKMAQIVGDISVNQEGDDMSIANGIIGGAIEKQELLDAIDDLPDDGLPVSKDMIKNLLDMCLVNDMDTNGDAEMDAVSVGMKFTSLDGIIVGVSE